jgi:SAM-dependent methyltransferase
MFFTPGYTSPFAQWDPAFSVYLLKLFGAVAPLLALNQGDRVIDSGCGYAWTTEWLFRSGFDPIGLDICRTYLEVGLTRMGASRPHLVIADVEHLPFAPGIARAVLAYESFHHIPDRARAMRAYERVLQDGGVVILAEPGAAHEQAQVAIDAMQKYGILEKGMELDDVLAYARGTALGVEQLYLMRMAHGEIGANANAAFLKTHSVLEGNLFRLTKGASPRAPVEHAGPGSQLADASFLHRVWHRLRG